MSPVTFYCTSLACSWTGEKPSISGPVGEMILRDQQWVRDDAHIPICPVCFAVARVLRNRKTA